MTENNSDNNWNLYVLKYNYSGNYYVGTALDFRERMLDHLRKTSPNGDSSIWSSKNNSTKGFKYYWFNINENGTSQSTANLCENTLADEIIQIIRRNNKHDCKPIDVSNAGLVNREYNVSDYPNPCESTDSKIDNYLKNLKSITLEKTDENPNIKCIEIGACEEFTKDMCNEKWEYFRSVIFPKKDK